MTDRTGQVHTLPFEAAVDGILIQQEAEVILALPNIPSRDWVRAVVAIETLR